MDSQTDNLPSTPYEKYPLGLAHDIALASSEEDIQFILNRHGLTETDYDYICDLPAFKKELTEWKQKIHMDGYGFKLKAKAMAEAYLPYVQSLLLDPIVAPSVKVDLFKYLTKVSDLEPKKDAESNAQNKLVIEINTFGSTPEPKEITITNPYYATDKPVERIE